MRLTALVLLFGCTSAAAEELQRVAPSALRVEAGDISPAGAVRHPGLRAVVPGATGRIAIAFVYRGPTRQDQPLASGELRRQIGLKLRAQDTCNVLYVMWHIEPTPGIQVQLKANPGQRTHEECRDHGYRTLEARIVKDVPAIQVGERHTLAAWVKEKRLHIVVDDRAIWEGPLPDEVFAFDGPVGIRSDNGEFDVEVYAIR